MKRFLSTGYLGTLAVGMPSSEATRFLGAPESVGVGIAKTRIEAYCNRSLQVAHRFGKIVFIGLYFNVTLGAGDSPKLPLCPGCETPFTSVTNLNDFQTFLAKHNIPWKQDSVASLEDQVNLKVGRNVTATFERGCLISLQSSSE